MKNTVLRLALVIFASLPLMASAATEAVKSESKPAVSQSAAPAAPAAQVATEQSININTADAAALQQALNGVGAVKAKAIVEYREAHGAFASVDELLEVKGIGPAILQKNRSKLRVN